MRRITGDAKNLSPERTRRSQRDRARRHHREVPRTPASDETKSRLAIDRHHPTHSPPATCLASPRTKGQAPQGGSHEGQSSTLPPSITAAKDGAAIDASRHRREDHRRTNDRATCGLRTAKGDGAAVDTLCPALTPQASAPRAANRVPCLVYLVRQGRIEAHHPQPGEEVTQQLAAKGVPRVRDEARGSRTERRTSREP